MKNKQKLLLIVVLLIYVLILSSCFTLGAAAVQDIKNINQLKSEAAMTSGDSPNWRSELTTRDVNNKDIISSGGWRGGAGWTSSDFMHFQNMTQEKWNGVSRIVFNKGDSFGLVSADNQPAGATSSLTLKVLGSSDNVIYTIKYNLAINGNSFTIIDLGGIIHPLLRMGTYTSTSSSGNNEALAGYGELTVINMNSNLSINMININGGPNNSFSKSYPVNLRPSSGILSGGSYKVGDVISGKTVVPIGNYEITVRWSNGVQSTQRATVSNSGIMVNFVNP